MTKKEFFRKNKQHDPWMFQTGFNGYTSEETFKELKLFLKDNGFENIPLPDNARRLWWDYLKPDDDGNFGDYVWHPVRITQHAYHVNGLHLMIFNEDYPNHMAMWEETYGEEMEKESNLYHYVNQNSVKCSYIQELFDCYDYLLNSNVFHLGEVNKVVELFLEDNSSKDQIDKLLKPSITEFNNEKKLIREERKSFINVSKKFISNYAVNQSELPFEMIYWEKLYWFLKLLLPKLHINKPASFKGVSLSSIKECIESILNQLSDSFDPGKTTLAIERRHAEEYDYYFNGFIGEFVDGLPHGFFVLKNEVDCIVEESIYVQGNLLVNYSYDFFEKDKLYFDPEFTGTNDNLQTKQINIKNPINHKFSNITQIKDLLNE